MSDMALRVISSVPVYRFEIATAIQREDIMQRLRSAIQVKRGLFQRLTATWDGAEGTVSGDRFSLRPLVSWTGRGMRPRIEGTITGEREVLIQVTVHTGFAINVLFFVAIGAGFAMFPFDAIPLVLRIFIGAALGVRDQCRNIGMPITSATLGRYSVTS